MPTTALTTTLTPFSQGFLLCASIIVAIGPQNLFILRQGLRRRHLFATALFSTLADVILITLGVGGLSALITNNNAFHAVITAGSTVFLLYYGIRSLLNALRPASSTASDAAQNATMSVKATILATLSFALLNPGAYLDTLMIIGSKSLAFSGDQRLVFGLGAILGSTFWFFTLTYGASRLSPILRSPLVWRALDVLSGCIMLGIAATMFSALQSCLS